jgi:hypothetical protein
VSSGRPSFGLTVDRSLSARVETAAPGHVVAADLLSTDEPYGLLLFTADGWLESVELVWYGDAPPSIFPDLSLFDPPVARH